MKSRTYGHLFFDKEAKYTMERKRQWFNKWYRAGAYFIKDRTRTLFYFIHKLKMIKDLLQTDYIKHSQKHRPNTFY